MFQTPFLYDPSAGNLLLYVDNISGANSHVGTEFFDAENLTSDSISRLYGSEGSPSATTGTLDSTGLIAEFRTGAASAGSVPEPLSLSLFGAGLAGAAAIRRRKAKSA